jgi:putative selenium metabolism hydrolase
MTAVPLVRERGATWRRQAAARLLADAEAQTAEMAAMLRQLIAIPSTEGKIGPITEALAEHCLRLGFDEVRHDSMGNLLARVGDGPRVLLYDSHVDTVGVGDPAAWKFDPFTGREADGVIWGRGAGDEKGSTPPMLYGLSNLKQRGLLDGWTLYYFANMEEWCDGIAPNALVEHEGIRPHAVVVGEPTNCAIYRGHRGRIEVEVIFHGRSSHAAHPELGESALSRALPFLRGLDALSRRLPRHHILGRGTVVATEVTAGGPSLNAVPDVCRIYLDRRVVPTDTVKSVLDELRALPGAADAEIAVPQYAEPSYTGFVFEVPKVFPAWLLERDHPLIKGAQAASRALWHKPAALGHWGFSTNATYWVGKARIPAIGFGPGDETTAHSTLDSVPIAELSRCCAFYAALPLFLDDSYANPPEGRDR